MKARADVSIIIAVYKAEKYIERCLRSLFGQTAENIEYIFVDDCTPDSSFDIIKRVLKEFPKRREQVIVIRHDENRGVSAARTTGMRAAGGEYQIHCDPDDWMELDAIETLYATAKKHDADIVSGGALYHSTKGTESYPCFVGVHDGKESILNWKFNFSLWKQIIKTQLIKEKELYPWPCISYGEDTGVTIRAFALSRKTIGIDKVIYNYSYNLADSLSGKSSEKRVCDLDIMFKKLWVWMEGSALFESSEISSFINRFKNGIRVDLLKGNYRDIKLFYKIWPDILNVYIDKLPSFLNRLIFRCGKYAPITLYSYLGVRRLFTAR